MNTAPECFQKTWVYAGPGPGKGVHHDIVSHSPQEIITWSHPSDPKSSGGWSWLGTPEEFQLVFKPA